MFWTRPVLASLDVFAPTSQPTQTQRLRRTEGKVEIFIPGNRICSQINDLRSPNDTPLPLELIGKQVSSLRLHHWQMPSSLRLQAVEALHNSSWLTGFYTRLVCWFCLLKSATRAKSHKIYFQLIQNVSLKSRLDDCDKIRTCMRCLECVLIVVDR